MPDIPTEALTGVTRFDRKLRVVQRDGDGPCWEWVGANDGEHGYGSVYFEGRTRKAYRVIYELLRGPITDGLALDHLCRNPPCCNPDHLEPVTIGENNRRGAKSTMSGLLAPAETCVNGHPYTPENTVFRNGVRKGCKECQRLRSAAHYQANHTNRPKVACRVCGKPYHHMSVRRHERDVHGYTD